MNHEGKTGDQIIIHPDILFENATAFFYIAHICDRAKSLLPNQNEIPALEVPAIVNLTLSIELFLKLLIMLESGSFHRTNETKEHLLATLYVLIKDETKCKIEKSIHLERDEFMKLIEANDNNFVKFRYCHEGIKGVDTQIAADFNFLYNLAVVLRELLQITYLGKYSLADFKL
ncbi:MAG: hypothetical protein KKA67_05615 [Spirochaetes bacterium]|nr:hypothetical protein [Spirochaetota bacterium]MBU1079627.1 hypothetical protein [Spirochaetota bacterium]